MGRAKGKYRYRADLPDGAHHTRPVHWIRDDLPRSAFRQDLLYSMGAYMTVCRIHRNNAEERIRAVLDGQLDPGSDASAGEVTEELEAELQDLATLAMDQIRSLITERFHDHDLARLVDGVLRAQGYRTALSPPGPDGGVDIIAGQGPLGFESPRLLVQVKSSPQPVDVSVLRELQGVMGSFGAEQGVLVSWGGFRRSVYSEARRHFFGVRLWDADDLIGAITDCYTSLSADLQAELPLKQVWTVVLEEE